MTIETYNQIALEYLQTTRDRRPEREFEAFCHALTPGSVVLDAGCAWGRDCQAFYQRGFRVMGVDLSARMLKLAENVAPDCSFIHTDFRELPFTDEGIDGIWCCASLLHLKRTEAWKALSEFKRVLKAGGTCCILVKEGVGEEITRQGISQGKPRFFTYFSLDEIQEQCVLRGFSILDGRITNERGQGRKQNWIYVLVRK